MITVGTSICVVNYNFGMDNLRSKVGWGGGGKSVLCRRGFKIKKLMCGNIYKTVAEL